MPSRGMSSGTPGASSRRSRRSVATPTVDVAPLTWIGDSRDAVERLIETETEAIDALKRVIPPSGNEGRSEALEHLMEHLILRKQNQVDFLLRSLRRT